MHPVPRVVSRASEHPRAGRNQFVLDVFLTSEQSILACEEEPRRCGRWVREVHPCARGGTHQIACRRGPMHPRARWGTESKVHQNDASTRARGNPIVRRSVREAPMHPHACGGTSTNDGDEASCLGASTRGGTVVTPTRSHPSRGTSSRARESHTTIAAGRQRGCIEGLVEPGIWCILARGKN
jgi:hypothetical protein